jgi:hypothetical protein
MGLIDFVAEVIASPVTIAAKALDTTIKTVEALPEVVEKTAEKIEDAFDKVGK